jgi:hypothetical protein
MENKETNSTGLWRSRWYYILVNKTSGKKYIGQTVRADMEKYLGSGSYWKKHCAKHGGYNKENIKILEQHWYETELDAQQWLDLFAERNNNYWKDSNKEWANLAIETTKDSAFSGFDADKRKEVSVKGATVAGRIAKNSGQIYKISSIGGKIGGKATHKQKDQITGKSIHAVKNGKLYGRLGGKIAGMMNAQKGRMSEIGAIGGAVSGKINGKLAAKRNMESGRWDEIRRSGTIAASKKVMLLRIYCRINGIEKPGKWFSNVNKDSFDDWKNGLTDDEKMTYTTL